MKCYYCGDETPMTRITFIPDGRVPGIRMKRNRAKCSKCTSVPIDRTSADPAPEQSNEKEYAF